MIIHTKQQILHAILRNDFLSFLHKSFLTINPGTNFKYNWHLKLISDYLDAIENKKIKRLIINIPPRSLKSTCVSIAWPAWLLGHMPEARVIVASYAMQLSIKHSVDCQSIMHSDWYRQVFPDTVICKSFNTKKKYVTTKKGFRMATSVGGSVTGEGADILIIDDPHNPTHGSSKKLNDKVLHWYENTFATRLNDPENGAIIIVMQRLHNNDLCHNIISKQVAKNWTHLVIPAIADQDIIYRSCKSKYLFKKNTSLHYNHLPIKYLNQLKQEIGEDAFLAQYQQAPKQSIKGILEKKYIAYYNVAPPKLKMIVQSWDTAFKTNNHNDNSVCTTWGIDNSHNFFLLNLYIDKVDYPTLKQKVIALHNDYKSDIILIEDHGSGQSIIQDLEQNKLMNIVKITNKDSKLTRFSQILHMFFARRVFLPANNVVVTNNMVHQITSFPYCKHDDIVDSLSQFLQYFSTYYEQKNLVIREL